MHYFVKYGLKFLSLCDNIGVKQPTPLLLLLQSSRSITVPFEEYNSIVRLRMRWHFQVNWYAHRAKPAEGVANFISLPGKMLHHQASASVMDRYIVNSTLIFMMFFWRAAPIAKCHLQDSDCQASKRWKEVHLSIVAFLYNPTIKHFCVTVCSIDSC